MLEDDFTWVIRKALKGLAIAPSEAAALANLPETDVLAFTRGRFDSDLAARLAPALGLDPAALASHQDYEPAPLDLEGVTRIDLPFEAERVNAWLIRHQGKALLIDTGYDGSDLTEICGKPDLVLITHPHHDHIGGLPALAKHGIPIRTPHADGPLNAGEEILLGGLVIRTCDLSGHASPSLGFHIEGLAKPVLVTGDALFAGSMGGCIDPARYQHALERLRSVLAPLPGETVLLPGHGPATTLAEERLRNPFPLFA